MKYTVYLNAFAGATYEIEAESPEEAYQKVIDEKASLSDVSGSDWDWETPGEVSDENGNNFDIQDMDV